jgi:phosphoribosylaminoimidazolecarboxamide formyltransferase / IMP cyclohydrolase
VRALISVYDKTGLVPFARGLADLGFELVASGGTATELEDAGLQVTRVEDVTGFPEMLGGRVKTLHPRVHAGILARSSEAEDVATLEEHDIGRFDLVCVNLYPFESVAGRLGLPDKDVVEMIDIGGPSMLRAAAKNYVDVAAVARPADYDGVLAELRERGGTLSPETRRRLAATAFTVSAAYESAISRWFQGEEELPETFVPTFERTLDLAYGENPHQQAAYYAERGRRTHVLSHVEQLAGKPLSFNNVNDLSAARLLVRELDHPACVIVKHANPCGAAIAETIEDAYERARAADPVSAYGGVVVLNRAVTAELGGALREQFVEVLFAPGYDEQAIEALASKSVRILNDTERRRPLVETERDYKRVLGGLLVQDRDWDLPDRELMEVVCSQVSHETWLDLGFACRVVKHVTSNAIVLARRGQTIGIGAGQMSRVDSVRIALEKARELGHDVEGSVLASDAFFPFADGPLLALEAGVQAIIQPGGSKRDDEVIEAVSAAGAAMVFTGRRQFRH